jgi:hypothetical protein
MKIIYWLVQVHASHALLFQTALLVAKIPTHVLPVPQTIIWLQIHYLAPPARQLLAIVSPVLIRHRVAAAHLDIICLQIQLRVPVVRPL